jgi:PAS domain-containing protein
LSTGVSHTSFRLCQKAGSARHPSPELSSRRETPLSHSFCRHTVDAAAPLIVNDACDVTERVEAGRAPQEREEWFRSLIENAHNIATMLD